jgi:integrase
VRRIKKPKTITNNQAADIINWLDGRYKVIFDLACQSGLRISDILSLKVKDLSNPMTVYEKKSKRKRTFPISDRLYRNLQYLADLKNKDDFVFESHSKTGVSVHRSTIHRHIKKTQPWTSCEASAHSARRLYAQNILTRTGSVEKVQQALHHHKLSTTLAYLDNMPQNVKLPEEIATERQRENIFVRILLFIKKIFQKGGDKR